MLIATAIGLSLTRTFILVAIGVLVLATIAALVDGRSRPRRAMRPVALGLPAIALGLGISLAIGIATFATSVTGFTVSLSPNGPPSSTIVGSGEDPLDRMLLQSGLSDIQSLGGGRFQTYRRAIEVIAEGPVIGSGLGALVIAEYTFGGEAFDTPGKLPNVDNAWLTVGMKAGLLGIAAFGIMLALGVVAAVRGPRWLGVWLVPAWLGILALTLTQSFATTGYGPFVIGLLVVLPLLGYTDRRAARARAHE